MARCIAALFLTAIACGGAYPAEEDLFDFSASGNWGSYSIGQDGARAVTNTNLADILMSIDFPVSDCSTPYLMIHVNNAQVSDIGKSEVIARTIQLRVDTKDIWHVNEAATEIQESADGRSAVLVVGIPVNNEFLNELRGGMTLRIKIEEIPAFRTSLTGSRKALNRAVALCLNAAESANDDDRYFDRRNGPSADDESFF